MSEILKVSGLCKKYPSFELKDVGFTIHKGEIMGFIGRNGAGKTTTLKSLLNFVHPDSGTIEFFGKTFLQAESEIKQRIGFVSGGVDYYKLKKLKTIADVTKRFYDRWDGNAYTKYLSEFQLDENKTVNQLSAGMRVKFALALALSHNAEILLLDEPTSGLDPVSRDDLLDVFLDLADKGITILFSTHITSDLDKCADTITYIRNGRIIASEELKGFVNKYKLVELSADDIHGNSQLIGVKRSKEGFTALVKTENAPADCKTVDLEDIMVHLDKESE